METLLANNSQTSLHCHDELDPVPTVLHPAWQDAHAVDPASSVYFPTWHAVQVWLPFAEYLPGAHGTHVAFDVAPDAPENSPASHCVHDDISSNSL
jgi:hypothetical protein